MQQGQAGLGVRSLTRPWAEMDSYEGLMSHLHD